MVRAHDVLCAALLATAGCSVSDSESAPSVGDATTDGRLDDASHDDVVLEDAQTRDANDANLSDAHDGGVDASRDASIDGAIDGGVDALADAPSADASEGGDASACPITAGSTMVRIGAFCIDVTEVTNADYASFLAVDAGSLPSPPAACASNASYVPGVSWPPTAGLDAYPVVGVDWCDAYVYCASIGKRLCGAVSGGATPIASYADATKSAWLAACSNRGALAYPYGATYDVAACNGKDFPGGSALRAVGALSSCAGGGDARLRDMSGNVYEWEDSCDANVGSSDHCLIRGGGYLTPGPPGNMNLSCVGTGSTLARSSNTFVDVGFRCCGL